jgi:hypothetical protein
MKIFPEPFLFKDPIDWARVAVGSKFKFWFAVFIQLLCGAFVIYTCRTVDGFWSVIVILFMIVMPFNYLYALRKLLLELQKRENT